MLCFTADAPKATNSIQDFLARLDEEYRGSSDLYILTEKLAIIVGKA